MTIYKIKQDTMMFKKDYSVCYFGKDKQNKNLWFYDINLENMETEIKHNSYLDTLLENDLLVEYKTGNLCRN